VRIALHSRTGRTTGATQLEVNSFHHQAVDVLGAGLSVAARAHDGTVEAIECREHPFLVGVQWHAETLVDHPAHLALFRALVRAATRATGTPARRRMQAA
jgi:putative glutamine amidotransferase